MRKQEGAGQQKWDHGCCPAFSARRDRFNLGGGRRYKEPEGHNRHTTNRKKKYQRETAKWTVFRIMSAQWPLAIRIRKPFDLALLFITQIWEKEMLMPPCGMRYKGRKFAI